MPPASRARGRGGGAQGTPSDWNLEKEEKKTLKGGNVERGLR